MRTALAMLAAFAALVTHPTARADTFYQFQSPAENIDCEMGSLGNKAFASCEIADHVWAAPPRPDRCEGEWGNRFELQQDTPATLVCSSDTLRGSDMPTLSYGSAWSVNPLSCDSEPSGMTCTDRGTGHYFRVSRDSYELH